MTNTNLESAQRVILIVNTGSPAAPTRDAVASYLGEFLGDPRVVEMSRWLWLPILHGIIIPRRSEISAARYRTVWTDEGSPLVRTTAATASALQQHVPQGTHVAWAMCYGTERITQVLPDLLRHQPEELVVLPMFAQYATQTTEAVYDAVDAVLAKSASSCRVRRIRDYHNHPSYIRALAQSVREHWSKNGELGENGRLLISFHGIPQACSQRGDPYEKQCNTTARLLAEALGLSSDQWVLAYQSRFGRAKWLEPNVVDKVRELAGQGTPRLDVICPGFAADCLETLEEIGDELRRIYEQAGGGVFNYIPALNDRPEGIEAYAEIVASHRA